MVKLHRRKRVTAFFDFSDSTLSRKISNGTFTPPVIYGEGLTVWPDYELEIIAKAVVAGKSEADLRQLVTNLIQQRQNLSHSYNLSLSKESCIEPTGSKA